MNASHRQKASVLTRRNSHNQQHQCNKVTTVLRITGCAAAQIVCEVFWGVAGCEAGDFLGLTTHKIIAGKVKNARP